MLGKAEKTRTRGARNKNNSKCDKFNYHQQGVKSEPSKNVAAASASFAWQNFSAIIVDASGTPQAGDVEG